MSSLEIPIYVPAKDYHLIEIRKDLFDAIGIGANRETVHAVFCHLKELEVVNFMKFPKTSFHTSRIQLPIWRLTQDAAKETWGTDIHHHAKRLWEEWDRIELLCPEQPASTVKKSTGKTLSNNVENELLKTTVRTELVWIHITDIPKAKNCAV
jgi:hypothetical protein